MIKKIVSRIVNFIVILIMLILLDYILNIALGDNGIDLIFDVIAALIISQFLTQKQFDQVVSEMRNKRKKKT